MVFWVKMNKEIKVGKSHLTYRILDGLKGYWKMENVITVEQSS